MKLATPPPNTAKRTILGFAWDRAKSGPVGESKPQAPSEDVGDSVPQWNLDSIDLGEAWDVTKGDRENGPLIGHLDTGVDLSHPDIKANLWVNPGEIPDNGIDDDGNGIVDDVHGIDAVQQTGNPQDESDHGTHTAGTIAAVGDNDIGISGVMQKARLVPIKITIARMIPDDGIVRAMNYAKSLGIEILNHSWGGGPYDTKTHQAFANYPQALHVIAAGNNGTNNDEEPHWPANLDYDNIISVAASTSDGEKLDISQYGPRSVDVVAPGEDIYSTVPGGYGKKSATSFATPHVTGLAGLIATAYPDLTPIQIKDRILFGSDLVEGLRDVSLSGGQINAASSLENDLLAPGAPRDFKLRSTDAKGAVLSWKTPADDGTDGDAVRVEVRVSDQPITEENYDEALAFLTPDKTTVGQEYRAVLQGETARASRKLYFAAKAIDNVGNRSDMVSVESRISADSE